MDTPDLTTTKRCAKCGELKPLTTFNVCLREKDGRADQCKTCKAAYRQANKERLASHAKAYREANKERVAAQKKAYHQANKERISAASKARYEANKDKRLESAKAYREANQERIRERARIYYWANREHVLEHHREHQRKYNAANKDVCRAIKHRYRARKAQSGGSHTPAELDSIRSAQTDKRGEVRCWWCGKPITAWHVDHKIPLARGGSNGVGNLCLSCADCNWRKNAKTPSEFMGRLL